MKKTSIFCIIMLGFSSTFYVHGMDEKQQQKQKIDIQKRQQLIEQARILSNQSLETLERYTNNQLEALIKSCQRSRILIDNLIAKRAGSSGYFD